jgi:hypothetical protein
VLARSKTGALKVKRHRDGRPGRVAERNSVPTVSSPAATQSPALRRRSEASASQDEAVYACECGFVFQALVSTSVGCPHCGGAQAW